MIILGNDIIILNIAFWTAVYAADRIGSKAFQYFIDNYDSLTGSEEQNKD